MGCPVFRRGSPRRGPRCAAFSLACALASLGALPAATRAQPADPVPAQPSPARAQAPRTLPPPAHWQAPPQASVPPQVRTEVPPRPLRAGAATPAQGGAAALAADESSRGMPVTAASAPFAAPAPAPAPAPASASAPHPAPPPDLRADLPAVPPVFAGDAESLPALLARVLPGDPQVRVARALLQAAEERRVQARSRLAPVAGVNALRGNSQEVEFGRPLQRRTERVEATLRWNVYNQGNDAAELAGTTGDVAAAAQELRRAREEAAERIALAYAELLRVDELLARSGERLDAVRRLRARVQRQTELGRASDADARQAEASQLDAEIAQEQLLADREGARRRLAALAGGTAPRPLPVVLPPAAAPDAAALQPGIVAAAVERAEAARARVRPLASLLAPRIDFEYRQRLSDRTTPQLTTEQQHGWLLTARWEFPLGGEAQARRAEGERRAEAAEAEADRLRQVVEAEQVTLDPRSAGAERAMAQLERLSEQYAALLRAGELQYDAGQRTLAQLVLLHDGRFGAEQRRAEQASRLLAARLRRLALAGELLPALGLAAE